MGQQQLASFHCESTISWTQYLCKSQDPGLPLWPASLTKFRSCFKLVIKALDLPPSWTPASLRSGGATYYFVVHSKSPSDLMFLGRWACERSLRHYIQASVADKSFAILAPALRDSIAAVIAANA